MLHSRLEASVDTFAILKSNPRKELKELFKDAAKNFSNFNISSVIHIPIKDWQYGFVTLANKPNKQFISKDIEMLIPVVRRMGLALKYDSHIAKMQALAKDKMQQSQRVLFHQLLAPLISMRASYEVVRGLMAADKLDEEKLNTRIADIKDTLATTNDFLGMNQFFTKFFIENKVDKPTPEYINLRTFVIDKVRSNQSRAKISKNIVIRVIADEKQDWNIKSDKKLLSHILHALVDNAIKYSYNHIKSPYTDPSSPLTPPNGTPNSINIYIERNENINPSRSFAIVTENWGCPFPVNKEEQDRLRNYMERGIIARLFEENGTGIGLFVTEMLTKVLDGELIIDAEKNRTKMIIKFQTEQWAKY